MLEHPVSSCSWADVNAAGFMDTAPSSQIVLVLSAVSGLSWSRSTKWKHAETLFSERDYRSSDKHPKFCVDLAEPWQILDMEKQKTSGRVVRTKGLRRVAGWGFTLDADRDLRSRGGSV